MDCRGGCVRKSRSKSRMRMELNSGLRSDCWIWRMPRQWLAVYLMMIVSKAERGGWYTPIDEWEVKGW